MNSNRKASIIVGALILIAYSVLGALFLESPIIAMLLEIISGAASIGVAVLMLPILKSYNKNTTLGYTAVKIMEGMTYIVIAILLFSQIITTGTYLLIHEYHVYIFATGFLLLSYLLYQSKLVPRFISLWGIIASILMLISTIVNMISGSATIPFYISHLPVISNEIFLAVWLIVKGFN